MARALVLVHGFTQTASSWAAVEVALQERWRRRGGPAGHESQVRHPLRTVALDLPGHGGASSSRPEGLAAAAAELAERAAGAGAGRATWVGYSMGARPVLRLALERPELVEAVVLAGATPGIAGEPERAARRAADEALAARIERIGVAAFLEEWLAGPLFSHLSVEQAGRDARLANTAEGLAFALRRLGTGAEPSMWPRLRELTVPALLLAGERDEKFRQLAREMARAIEEVPGEAGDGEDAGAGGAGGDGGAGGSGPGGRGPRVRVGLVAGAGHAAPFERPQAFADLVVDWLLGGVTPKAPPARGHRAPAG